MSTGTAKAFGIRFIGQRNERTHSGICEFCGHPGKLTSYETSAYMVFLYVPVIPLRRKRVSQACDKCGNRLVINLDQWERDRQHEIDEAIDAFVADSTDRAKAIAAISTSIKYEDEAAFTHCIELLSDDDDQNVELLSLIGTAHNAFNHRQEAEAAYRMALRLEDVPRVREQLALCLIAQSRPDDACAYLLHLLDNDGDRSKLELLYLLVESYLRLGLRESGMMVLDQIDENFAGIRDDEKFKLYLHHVETGTPIPVAH